MWCGRSQTFEFLPARFRRRQQASYPTTEVGSRGCGGAGGEAPYRILASSLLMRFSSSSRALAFLRSAMNWTRPRMFELLELDLPRKPAAVDDMAGGRVEGDSTR